MCFAMLSMAVHFVRKRMLPGNVIAFANGLIVAQTANDRLRNVTHIDSGTAEN